MWDRKIDVTAIQFLLVQNRHQPHNWTLIGWGANVLGIVHNFENWLFSIVKTLQVTCIFILKENKHEFYTLKQQYLPHYWSDKGFMGIVLN